MSGFWRPGLALAFSICMLSLLGFHNSGIVDRHYFQSIYVREPNHVLFELASAGPGVIGHNSEAVKTLRNIRVPS